ncbi:MAG: radical SAM protein [Bacteroidia bacterium]|nr:radical SAM protein [Bacteroidia bacterium]
MKIFNWLNIKTKSTGNSYFSEYNSLRKIKHKDAFCYAPYNTMRFSVAGKILGCCRNRFYQLGSFPEQSIDEIWHGSLYNNLRTCMNNYDLSAGCQFCQRMLMQKNYSLLKSIDYDFFGTDKSLKYPEKLEFELSNTCNLNCIMCSGEFSSTVRKQRENQINYPDSYGESFLTQIIPYLLHAKRATFSGGETFLIELYYTLWEKIIEINPKMEIIIITNGTVLNDRIKDLLKRGNFYFAVSIDSFKKDNFENIRKKASFEKVIENFEYFYNYSALRNKWITVNICPLQQNWHEIPEIVSYLNKRSISLYFNNVDFPSYCAIRTMSALQINEIIEYYKNTDIYMTTNSVCISNKQLFDNLLNSVIVWHNEAIEFEKSGIDSCNDELKLKQYLFSMVENHINNTTYLSEENKIKLYNNFLTKHNLVLEKITDLNIKQNAIKNFSRLPIDVIMAETELCTSEKLLEKYIQTSKFAYES